MVAHPLRESQQIVDESLVIEVVAHETAHREVMVAYVGSASRDGRRAVRQSVQGQALGDRKRGGCGLDRWLVIS
jgi:hypothetical protein